MRVSGVFGVSELGRHPNGNALPYTSSCFSLRLLMLVLLCHLSTHVGSEMFRRFHVEKTLKHASSAPRSHLDSKLSPRSGGWPNEHADEHTSVHLQALKNVRDTGEKTRCMRSWWFNPQQLAS